MNKKIGNTKIFFSILILIVVMAAGIGFAFTTSRINNDKALVSENNLDEQRLEATNTTSGNDDREITKETNQSTDEAKAPAENKFLVISGTGSESNNEVRDVDKHAYAFFGEDKEAPQIESGFFASKDDDAAKHKGSDKKDEVKKESNKESNEGSNQGSNKEQKEEPKEQPKDDATNVPSVPIATQPVGDGSFAFLWDVTGVKNQPYLVGVNRAMNTVTVYGLDASGYYTVPVKAFACSVGRAGHETVTGRFKTTDKYDWRLMIDNTYARYAIRIYKGIMFHSVGYYQKAADTLEYEEFNKLGEPASLGCIRMKVSDELWLYNNCPKGFVTVIYDDPTCPGPLGKPETMKIDTSDEVKRNWDPTDPDPNSPWNK